MEYTFAFIHVAIELAGKKYMNMNLEKFDFTSDLSHAVSTPFPIDSSSGMNQSHESNHL